jgi:hypothetical protein
MMRLTIVADYDTRARLQRDEFRCNREPVLHARSCELGGLSSILGSNLERIFLYIRVLGQEYHGMKNKGGKGKEKLRTGKVERTPRGSVYSLRVSSPVLVTFTVTEKLSTFSTTDLPSRYQRGISQSRAISRFKGYKTYQRASC